MMKKLSIILILNIVCFTSFSQWRSYYPEEKTTKPPQKNSKKEDTKKLFDASFFNAIKAKSLEDYDEALAYFAKCIALDKKNPTPFYESAAINTAKGNYEIAIEQIKSAVTLDPKNRWYLLLYAKTLFSKQDFYNAALQYKKLIDLEPGNKENYYVLAETYIYANDFKKAIDVYNELEDHVGVDKTISTQKHRLYRQLNDIKGAIKELKHILKLYPDDIETMEILCELYFLNDEKEKAFELYKNLSIITPNNGRIHLTLADYYRESGDKLKSYEELKLAFKSTSLDVDTKIRILISYYKLVDADKEMAKQAYELSKILIEAHPNDLKCRAVFADILYIDNQYQKAKDQYLYILDKDKTKNEIWSQVLFIQAEQNDFEGMLKTSSMALEYFPTDPLFYYFNGLSNRWFNNYDDAIKSLLLGVEFVVENQNLMIEFYSNLADVYNSKQEYDLSDKHYEKVLDIDSNNVIALNNYAYYLSLRGEKLEKAKEMSYKCNSLEVDNGTYQDTYAWVLYQLKQYEQAEKWLLKALSNGGENNPVVVEHYGDVLYKLGKKANALNQWKKAKSLGEASKFLNQKIEEGQLYE